MISWPEDVIKSLARRRAVLFLGAGVSMNARNARGESPPSWYEFLKDGIERCPSPKKELRKLLKANDYLTCCQIIKQKLGHDWVPYVEERFLTPQFNHAKIHETIFKLDSSIVVTPNFDTLYDRYAQTKTENLLKVKHYYDDDIPRSVRGGGQSRLILKMHGCVNTPDKLVFTKQDYADARNRYSNFYRVIDALILTHTFIFIGCGMNDPDLSLVLEQYARSFSSSPPHYLLFSSKMSNDYKAIMEKNYNLRIIAYSSADNHKELAESLEDLVGKVEASRDDLKITSLW